METLTAVHTPAGDFVPDIARTFVNYTHPMQLKDQQKRRSVNSFISRNRRILKQNNGAFINYKNPKHPREKVATPEEQHAKVNTIRTIGGLRQDPFLSYSTKQSGQIAWTFDYFIDVFGPTYVWHPSLIEYGTVEGLRKDYIKLAMEHAIIFESVIAQCQASHHARESPKSAPSSMVLQHQGKAMSLLREKLKGSSPWADDTVVLCIMSLLSVDLMFRDFSAFEYHLEALRRLVKMRGGMDKLGWQGIIKFSISVFENLWTQYTKHRPESKETAVGGNLDYPQHPFSPALCETISSLPEGFREVALSRSLSTQTVELLSKMKKWSLTTEHQRSEGITKPLVNMRLPAECTRIVNVSSSSMEKFLGLGLMGFYNTAFNTSRLRALSSQGLDFQMLNIRKWSLKGCDRDCLIWTSICIAMLVEVAGVRDPELVQKSDGTWLLDTLIQGRYFPSQWADIEKRLSNFFWSESFAPRWRACWEKAVLRTRAANESPIGNLAEGEDPVKG